MSSTFFTITTYTGTVPVPICWCTVLQMFFTKKPFFIEILHFYVNLYFALYYSWLLMHFNKATEIWLPSKCLIPFLWSFSSIQILSSIPNIFRRILVIHKIILIEYKDAFVQKYFVQVIIGIGFVGP
jgi:hypothetical protein